MMDMSSARIKTIGEVTSILVGRMMESANRARGVWPLSNLDLSLGLPVSFRRRVALLARSAGPYVSCRIAAEASVETPVCEVLEDSKVGSPRN
jgi:hypothetical protein